MADDRIRARDLAREYAEKGDPTGWFEQLYRKAERPWDDRTANSHLLDFWRTHPLETAGKTALVIACGFGQDAEQIGARGLSYHGVRHFTYRDQRRTVALPEHLGRIRRPRSSAAARSLERRFRFHLRDQHPPDSARCAAQESNRKHRAIPQARRTSPGHCSRP